MTRTTDPIPQDPSTSKLEEINQDEPLLLVDLGKCSSVVSRGKQHPVSLLEHLLRCPTELIGLARSI